MSNHARGQVEETKRELQLILSRSFDPNDAGAVSARIRAQTLFDSLCLASGKPKPPDKRTPNLKVVSNDDPKPPAAA